jgi:malate permease and related proteins
MELFLSLVLKLAPLSLLILLGYGAGRFLRLPRRLVATVLIYFLAPIVVFHGVATTDLSPALLSLPLVSYALCCLIAFTAYRVSGNWWSDSTRSVLGFTAGSGNTGYFGIPVALTLFGPQALGPVVLILLGFILYENTLGFYLVARGRHTVRQSLGKVATLPTVYAFCFGVIVSLQHVHFGPAYYDVANAGKLVYSILGMMIVGMALVHSRVKGLDRRLILSSFFVKFAVWPVAVGTLVWLDSTYWHFYDSSVYPVMILQSIVPLAANTVTVATLLRVQPEKAAVAVLLSTIFALVYIPLVLGLLGFT